MVYWQRNPVLLLQVEAGANSTNSETQRSHIRGKLKPLKKKNEKKKKKSMRVFLSP